MLGDVLRHDDFFGGPPVIGRDVATAGGGPTGACVCTLPGAGDEWCVKLSVVRDTCGGGPGGGPGGGSGPLACGPGDAACVSDGLGG